MSEAGQRWYRQPIAWLGVLIFVGSLAGCISMIVLAARHDDPPLPLNGEQVFKMPVAHAPNSAPAPKAEATR